MRCRRSCRHDDRPTRRQRHDPVPALGVARRRAPTRWTSSSPDAQRLFAQVDAFNDEVQAAGAWVFGGGLHPPTSATVVRSTDGDVSMTDGPYAESKEQMGGFWVIEAADLDAALEWARKACGRLRGPGRGPPVPG